MRKFLRPFSVLFIALFSSLLASTVQAGTEPNKKEWTFLVFLNGFNNLDSFGAKDINEMEKVGSTNQVNVVVQWASYQSGDVKRVFVEKDNDPSVVNSSVIENMGRVDMGDPRTLIDFVTWASKKYPAKKYFIDVWNHGSGWHKNRKDSFVVKDISNDDYSGNSISTEELGESIREISKTLGQKIDIYGSDACLMSMVEIAAEMKDVVNVYVGSQDLEPADGWPYDRLLDHWNKIQNASAEEVAKILVREYVASYPGQSGITQSAFDLRKYDGLVRSVRDLSSHIRSQTSTAREKIIQAAGLTDSFYFDDYRDLGDFVKQVETNVSSVSRTVLSKVRSAVSDFTIANATSSDHAAATGVGFWLPSSSWSYQRYSSRYGALQFNSDTQWNEALSSLYP